MGIPIILYGVTIQKAIASGDLAEMKKLAQIADRQKGHDREVQTALKSLKAEIAKLERRRR